MFRAQDARRLANGDDLGVRRRIVGLCDLIDRLGQDLSVFYNNAGEGPPSLLHIRCRQFDSVLYEVHLLISNCRVPVDAQNKATCSLTLRSHERK
jgi:hypothetical protein